MKLLSLSLQNFRQFNGVQKLNFQNKQGTSITVVHGENGSGKTSILNAFKWGFYGVTDFDTKEKNILNEQCIAEADNDADIALKVTIEFEHDGLKYTLIRLHNFKKIDGMNVEPIGVSTIELSWIDEDGAYDKSSNPSTQINQILPEKLHSYFFFNGERIEKLANASAAGQISAAIKTLMGLEIVERAREHLKGPVTKKIRQSMRSSADNDLDALNDQQDKLTDEVLGLEQSLTNTRNNIDEFSTEIDDISQRLEVIKDAAKLQTERKTIETRIDGIKDELQAHKKETATIISKNGFLAFFGDAAKTVANELEARREKGDLPGNIKAQFIDDLIANEKCICGTPLPDDSEELAQVTKYKKKTVAPGIENAFNSITGTLKFAPDDRRELFIDLKKIAQAKNILQKERKEKNGRLDEISGLLKTSVEEDIVKMELRRETLKSEKDNAIMKKGEFTGKLKELKQKQKELDIQIEERSNQNKETALINRKIQTATECGRVLSDLYDALSHQTRKQLSEKVNSTFKHIIRKSYWAEIDEDYRLQIYKEIHGQGKHPVLEKSTGEKQVTSLSFIASIINLAKEKNDSDNQFFRGGIYPIVMDSPFGALDDEYRGLVASSIPELADQIILFATSSQWKGEVEQACKPYVGSEISLIYHDPDLEDGEESAYKQHSEKYEYTTIKEGYHG